MVDVGIQINVVQSFQMRCNFSVAWDNTITFMLVYFMESFLELEYYFILLIVTWLNKQKQLKGNMKPACYRKSGWWLILNLLKIHGLIGCPLIHM